MQRLSRLKATLLALSLILTLPVVSAGASATPSSTASGRIAFASDRDWGTVPSAQIYVVGADGSGPVRLTNFPWWAMQPTWSPDGTRIAFTGVRPEAAFRDGSHAHLLGHGHDIYVMDADGSHVKDLTNEGTLGDQTPAWSPDGTSIAFMRGCTPSDCLDPHIAVVGVDGSHLHEITSGPNFDYRPTWSPDGLRIAFERDFPDGTSAIEIASADGTGLRRVLTSPCYLDPAWSPDGSRISFWNCQLPGLQVVDPATGHVTTIVRASALPAAYVPVDEGPYDRWSSWSPDGRWLALGNCCEGSDGVPLMIVSADGRTVNQVPNGSSATSPSWSPVG